MRFLSGFSKVGFVENYGLIELLVEMVSFPYQHIFSGFKMTLLPSTHAISVSTIAITLTWRHISLLNRIFLPGSGNYRIYIIFNGYSVMHVKIICRIRFEKNWKKKKKCNLLHWDSNSEPLDKYPNTLTTAPLEIWLIKKTKIPNFLIL